MHHEIERKFLIRRMPRIFGIAKEPQERHFLQHGDLVEERIQKKGDVYEYEFKTMVSLNNWNREKRTIPKEEFEELCRRAPKTLLRESYSITKSSPRISIKKYKGEYKGLQFVEVEFDSLEEAEAFTPLDWMGTEITHTPLGREAWMLDLDREHFLVALRNEMDKLNPESFLK